MVQDDLRNNINPCGDQVLNYQAKFNVSDCNVIYRWLLDNLEARSFKAIITTDVDLNDVHLKVRFKHNSDYTRTILTWPVRSC